jgi:hypothetical protein
MRYYWKVPKLGQKILAALSFKIVSLGTYSDPIIFFHASKAPWKSFSLMLLSTAAIPFGCQTLFQNVIPSVSFSICETKRILRGLNRRIVRMENDNHVVVSHKLCGFQGRVGRRVVMMKKQCGACSNFLLRSPGNLHN